MPGRPSFVPPVGAPLAGIDHPLSVVQDIGERVAAMSAVSFDRADGHVGSGGIRMSNPIPMDIRLFEIEGNTDQADTGGSTSGDAWSEGALATAWASYADPQASSSWWWTLAKEIMYWPNDTQPGWHADSHSDATDIIWDIVSKSDPTPTVGDWVWCVLEPWSDRWVVVSTPGAPNKGIPVINTTEVLTYTPPGTTESVTDYDITVPPYGVVMIDILNDQDFNKDSSGDYTGTNDSVGAWHVPVKKPQIPFARQIYINGPDSIAPGKPGTVYDASNGPVLALYEHSLYDIPPLPGQEMGINQRDWTLHTNFPSCGTMLAVVEINTSGDYTSGKYWGGVSGDYASGEPLTQRGQAYIQWHELRGGPRLMGRCTSYVNKITTWFQIDHVTSVDYGLAYANADGTVDVFNPGSLETNPEGKCIDQGVMIDVQWDASLNDGVGGYKVNDSPCSLGCDG